MAPTDKSIAASVSERQGLEPGLVEKGPRQVKRIVTGHRRSKEIETNVHRVLLIVHKRRVP
jgi:hypothetical protein